MYKTILLPIDLNEESSWRTALPTAIDLCKSFGSELYVMTVTPSFGFAMVAQYFPPDYEKKAIEAAKEKLAAFIREHVPGDIKAHHVVGHGTIYEEIIRVAREIDVDLILMASHRPEMKDYLIGPNANSVVQHSQRSILVVREKP